MIIANIHMCIIIMILICFAVHGYCHSMNSQSFPNSWLIINPIITFHYYIVRQSSYQSKALIIIPNVTQFWKKSNQIRIDNQICIDNLWLQFDTKAHFHFIYLSMKFLIESVYIRGWAGGVLGWGGWWHKLKQRRNKTQIVEFGVDMTCTCTYKGPIFHYKA